MANYNYDGAASIRGVALRVTRLNASGAPDTAVGTDCATYLSHGFIRFAFTPEYSEGDEIEVKNAAGEVCVLFKMPDTLKQVTFALELCDPDPILTEMLVGGDVLVDTVDATKVLGYASAATGLETVPNGVGIEVWSTAISNGKAASVNPYWHYLFPWAQMKLTGERALENGNLATVFEGRGVGNEGFGAGPSMTGYTGQFDWPFPAFSTRPYSYTRVPEAPIAVAGCQTITA